MKMQNLTSTVVTLLAVLFISIHPAAAQDMKMKKGDSKMKMSTIAIP